MHILLIIGITVVVAVIVILATLKAKIMLAEFAQIQSRKNKIIVRAQSLLSQ